MRPPLPAAGHYDVAAAAQKMPLLKPDVNHSMFLG